MQQCRADPVCWWRPWSSVGNRCFAWLRAKAISCSSNQMGSVFKEKHALNKLLLGPRSILTAMLYFVLISVICWTLLLFRECPSSFPPSQAFTTLQCICVVLKGCVVSWSRRLSVCKLVIFHVFSFTHFLGLGLSQP